MALERIVLEKSGWGGWTKSDHLGIFHIFRCFLQDNRSIDIDGDTHALLAVEYYSKLYLSRVGVAPTGLSLVKTPKFLIFRQIECFLDLISPRLGWIRGSLLVPSSGSL